MSIAKKIIDEALDCPENVRTSVIKDECLNRRDVKDIKVELNKEGTIEKTTFIFEDDSKLQVTGTIYTQYHSHALIN